MSEGRGQSIPPWACSRFNWRIPAPLAPLRSALSAIDAGSPISWRGASEFGRKRRNFLPLFLCPSSSCGFSCLLWPMEGGGSCVAPSETRELNGARGPRCPQQPPGGLTGARKQREEGSRRSHNRKPLRLFRGREAFIRGSNQCSVLRHHLFHITLVVTACRHCDGGAQSLPSVHILIDKSISIHPKETVQT